MDTFDVVVIGSGPGGYIAALRASQLGLKTACVEKEERLGGVCLNVGCIPSKALLHTSELYEEARDHFKKIGICVEPTLDLRAMMAHKAQVVDKLTKGVAYLFKKNKVTHIKGHAYVEAPGRVSITEGPDKGRSLNATHIILATGSTSASLPGVEVDKKHCVTSTGALSFSDVPQRLLVVGGGVIGLELGSVWKRLGSRVTLVEYADRLLPTMDQDVSSEAAKFMRGADLKLSTKLVSVQEKGAVVEPVQGGPQDTIPCDHILIATGRRPMTEGLGLEELGVKKDEGGFVCVDSSYKTSVEGLYAIGDVVPGPMLAHKAEEEGVACVEGLVGQGNTVRYETIPHVVYTFPEIAAVGATEDDLKKKGVPYKVGRFPLAANGRAYTMGATEGFAKVIVDPHSDRVLGGAVVAPGAGEMIHTLVTIMEFGGSAEDMARMCFAHPTLSESLKEAALACGSGTLNL